MVQLQKQPEKLKLQAEVDRFLGLDKQVEESDVSFQNMPCLNACVMEACEWIA
jgi:hypothetical protein